VQNTITEELGLGREMEKKEEKFLENKGEVEVGRGSGEYGHQFLKPNFQLAH
jgi:hypothetical protein